MHIHAGLEFGPYKLIEPLGAGGMGEVWRARDTRLRRLVALKLLPASVSHDPVRHERFAREARAAAALMHPRVAQVFDVGEAHDLAYLVMELIEGRTLQERLAQGGVTATEAIRIVYAIAEGLAAAHARGITHRDMKPANVMLTGDGGVKILDFGLARHGLDPELTLDDAATRVEPESIRNDLTRDGQLLGTVPYMSPEQARGEPTGPASDVFSLGVILHEMLEGRRPFDGADVEETLARILAGDRRELVPRPDLGITDGLVALLRRCLSPEPASRFPDAHELLGALAPWTGMVAEAVIEPADDGNRIESLAVMPFSYRARETDEELEFLCDGVAENLIATLSRMSDVRVVSRHASFALRDETHDIPGLGDRLQVDAILLGDMRPRADRLLLNVELVGVPDGRRIWGERYDRALNDVVEIERDVADRVSRELRQTLSHSVDSQSTGSDVDPRAYLLYLKGRPLIVGSRDQMQRGAEYLQQASELDPGYAMPHVALTEAAMAQAFHGLIAPDAAGRLARRHANRAVEIAPDLPETQTAQAIVRYAFDWDFVGADAAFRRAIDLGGRDVAFLEYADFLAETGDHERAVECAEQARQLDPITPNPTHLKAYTFLLMGRLDEARQLFEDAIALHPNWVWGHIKLGKVLSRMNRHDEAVAAVRKAESAMGEGSTPLAWAWIGQTYARAGDKNAAHAILDRLRQPREEVSPDPFLRVFIHSGLGDREAAIRALEEGYEYRSVMCAFLDAIRYLEPELELAEEHRYLDLVRKIGIPAGPIRP